MQVTLIFSRKVVSWPHFESEGFWNSEVAYNCVFFKSRYTRRRLQGGEFNKGLQVCGGHKHPLIFATGFKSLTNQVQTPGKIEEIETRWTRVRVARVSRCLRMNTFENGLYKGFYAFLFLTKRLRKRIQRDTLHNSKAALWLVIDFKGMFFPHKMRMKMCISVIRWFSLK